MRSVVNVIEREAWGVRDIVGGSAPREPEVVVPVKGILGRNGPRYRHTAGGSESDHGVVSTTERHRRTEDGIIASADESHPTHFRTRAKRTGTSYVTACALRIVVVLSVPVPSTGTLQTFYFVPNCSPPALIPSEMNSLTSPAESLHRYAMTYILL
jgi:hypothetical protein